jgi:hypothetical protein
VLYSGKTTLGYTVSIAEAKELNRRCRHLFTAYHKDARKNKTPWILSTDFGAGRQQLHGKWAKILFTRPPPPKKK